MKKKLLLASAFLSLWGATAQAQIKVDTNRKWDGAVEFMLQEQQKQSKTLNTTKNASTKGLIISCSDAESVAETIRLNGYEATIISDNVITADIPVHFIPTMANMEEVNYINGARQFYPTMHTSRKVTGADKIQAGEELETPFTGKGVIVGVIDQGFEYKHVAFLDENQESRVLSVWNHQAGQRPTDRVPSTGDNMQGSHGHATHVANIAAGSRIKENEYSGIAPEADLIMVSSTFEENKVLEEAKYIQEFAQKAGKPYVINMSFGSQIGPHDGLDAYCLGMNEISQPGGILVAAMGNEGHLKLHAQYKFEEDNKKVYLLFEPDQYGFTTHYIDLWEQTGDGKEHLKVRPFVLNVSRKDFKDDNFWRRCSQGSANIDKNNQKEHFYYTVNIPAMQEGNGNRRFGLEISGNAGDEFHAWVNPQYGQIASKGGYIKGNNEYCVGEGAASIPYAIAVASFNGNNGTYTSAIDGRTYSLGGREGSVSSFSSRGPSLGAEPKPLVAAPGHNVASAISQYQGRGNNNTFNPNDLSIVSIVKNGTKKNYYAVMSGTSMASPTVTGIVALWLEANPKLTYDQIKTIIKETAKRDAQVGMTNEWDIKRGYGKIDAYAGLKKALELAENTGINDQLNSEAPITISRNVNQFRILFNNDESYANIALYNASGLEVKREILNDVRRGNETVVSTAGLPAGVYVVRINTTASTASKKMLVK